jgi:demethylmenaquinone methyltransferase/2-methoxy-6-polyprenyl-1,4-benzoquinol methylase
LEARLNASCSAYTSYVNSWPPQAQFLRGLHWFCEAGLEAVQGRTFADSVQAPLQAGLRTALASLFAMLWSEPSAGVALDDWRECQRLCRPESPDFLPDLPDYYAFFTYTMFVGRTPAWTFH